MSSIEFTRSRALTAVVAVSLTGVVGGGVWAVSNTSAGGRDVQPTVYTPAHAQLPQASSPDDAVAATLAGLDSDAFKEAHVGAAPPSQQRKGNWFYATINGGSSPVPVNLWEAHLAQGAVADRLAGDASNLADVIVGSSVTATSGATADGFDMGAGDIAPGQAFGSADQSDQEIIAEVTRNLVAMGLEPQEVRVLRPLDPAIFVRASVTDPEHFPAGFDALRNAVVGDPVRYEGVYLEVDSAQTGPLVINSVAYRSGAGRLWIAPGYDAIVGANHGGPALPQKG